MAEKDRQILALKAELDAMRADHRAAMSERAHAQGHGDDDDDDDDAGIELEQEAKIIINAEDGTVNLTLNIHNDAPAPAHPKKPEAVRWVVEQHTGAEHAKAAVEKKQAAQKQAARKKAAAAKKKQAAAKEKAARQQAAEKKRAERRRRMQRERAPTEAGKKINDEDRPFPFPLEGTPY